MRTAKRTFFNVLFQPYRIGKHIARVLKKKYAYQKRTYIVDRRMASTPRMSVLARYHKVKHFKIFADMVKRTESKFVRRNRHD